MALERNPDDLTNAELARRRADQIDAELQADPELGEGPASVGRIALFTIALVAILGVVFYGLNSSTTSPDATPMTQTTPASPPAGGTAMTPRPPAGQTTGSSMTPSQPAPPPAANTPAPAPRNNAAPATGAPSGD